MTPTDVRMIAVAVMAIMTEDYDYYGGFDDDDDDDD